MKRRSCIRMDDLDKDQRKELNSRIKKTVQNFNKEIQDDLESHPMKAAKSLEEAE